MEKLKDQLTKIQDFLNFETCSGPQFVTKYGLGRIAIGGFSLGLILGIHIMLFIVALLVDFSFSNFTMIQWSLYVIALMCFHFGEFIVTCVYKPNQVSYDSYVINHSTGYTAAAIMSWFEFWIEILVLPQGTKYRPLIFLTGICLVIMGQFYRAAAMWTAKSNFNHIIMEKKEENHQLVTHGVYEHFRHPSYFGWYWWCVGTQILLCNPICTIAYAYVAIIFFRKRIPYEEALLCNFYKEEYPRYMACSSIGIPFVTGYQLPDQLKPKTI